MSPPPPTGHDDPPPTRLTNLLHPPPDEAVGDGGSVVPFPAVTRSSFDSASPTLAAPRGTSLPELGPPLSAGDLGACGKYRV
ncbi:MAG: hypothetical protein K2V38_02195, partial [Gemmataceae bacterium]|nr:hypothetical protein [Gemmataceae bacterium]